MARPVVGCDLYHHLMLQEAPAIYPLECNVVVVNAPMLNALPLLYRVMLL